jgi:streptomycin 6-kinase
VRLLAYDPDRHALLLERCVPGEPLSSRTREGALDVMISLLPRLGKPAAGAPFRTLADQADRWAAGLEAAWEAAGRPFERALVDAALEALADLPGSSAEPPVLVNQDLQPGNVLSARRERWLVIDPVPLLGERAFAAVPVVRSFEMGHTFAQVQQGLDRLSAALSVDRDRLRRWTIAQAVAWGIGTEFQRSRAETARWLLQM